NRITMTNSNLMVVLSSPSGAGKTTLTKKIQQKFQNFKISVSHTTRKARPNEVDGIDYFFVEKDEFQKKIENKDFYEYAKIFNNYYGTSKESVNSILKNNNSILFDIDWQGNKQLSDYKELKLIKIFLVPPNKNELKKRLIQRNQDNKDVIEERLKAFDKDTVHWLDYDYIVINDNLDNCFTQIEKIIFSNNN
ncbi:MAG: guanylate kinase, partial [Pelagibacteraceae bacterium]